MRTRLVTLALCSVAAAGCGSGDAPAPTAAAKVVELPPPGERIVFARDGDLVTVGVAGRAPVQLTRTDLQESDPRWSPDGRHLAYVRSDGRLYVARADGSAPRLVVDSGEPMEGPAWTPDGRWIVYHAETDAGFELRRVPAAGGEPEVLHRIRRGFIGDTDVSPDGRTITALIDRTTGGALDVVTLPVDGGRVRHVTRGGGEETSPRWSVDGSRIFYGAEDGALYSVRPDGSGRTKLSDGVPGSRNPRLAVSPDGTRLAFTAGVDRYAGAPVHVLDIAGGAPARPVTKALSVATMVDW